MKNKDIRLRMAPSPTGLMHIGTLRTVLYDYLFARQNKGKLLLRIEDTDQSRSVEGAVENLLSMLAWVGIVPDEGPHIENRTVVDKGDFGPYTQSERLPIYREHAAQLVRDGHAYACFCTPQRLDEMRTLQQKAGQPPMYDRLCQGLSREELDQHVIAQTPHVIRMKVPRGQKVVVHDLVRGKVVFQTDTVDDQVIMKSDGFPTYHLAVVVDDHLMKVSHVFRGEEWLPSTPKHLLLYKAFGWTVPVYAHLPLLLNADKSKLSKRQGDVSVEDYIAKGYLKEAIINFVALLGWNPGGGSTDEIFTLSELEERFSIEKVHKAGAVVDVKRLNWINAHYIKKMPIDQLMRRAQDFLETKEYYASWDIDDKHAAAIRLLTVEQDRLERLIDVGEENQFFFGPIEYDASLLYWKENTREETLHVITRAHDLLQDVDDSDWTREHLTSLLMDAAGDKRGDFLWPLRAALTGEQRSPSPMDCAWVLGKSEAIARLDAAQKKLALM